MSLLIRPCHHHRFRAVLNDSFRLRREVFVDRLGWSLPDAERTAETGIEYDAFDGSAAFYLVNLSGGRVVATVRMTPTTAANLTCDDLAGRMGVEMPRGPRIVEMARLCADPRLSPDERSQTMRELRACIGLLCLRQGWSQSIGIGYDRHIQPLIRSGLIVQMLGAPMIFPGDDEPSFAILAIDPDRPERVAELMAGQSWRLDDPDEDPSLFIRHGDRAVA
ncbi:MAG: acyl-homoserine-lactone synthase [Caulobacteraceae bacterium]